MRRSGYRRGVYDADWLDWNDCFWIGYGVYKMTKDNMPDAIWASHKAATGLSEKKPDLPLTEYLLAEPVKDLLWQAREALDNIAKDMYDDSNIRPIITAIDKFLGENK